MTAPRAPATPTEPKLPPEGRAWLDRLITIAKNTLAGTGTPRLVNGTMNMTPRVAEYLHQFEGKIPGSRYELRFPTKDGPPMITHGQDEWLLTEHPTYRDQFPDGIPFDFLLLALRNKKNPEMIRQFDFPRDLLREDGTLSGAGLDGLLQSARDDYASETADHADAKDFDLPTDRPVGYVGISADPDNDVIVGGFVNSTKYLPAFLNSLTDASGRQRYHVVTIGEANTVVTGNPAALLQKRLQALYDAGIRDFQLEIACHGNDSGLYFDSSVLRPAELCKIFTKFSDCTFVLDTEACQNGGLSKAIAAYKDPSGRKGRIHLKLQEKIFAFNEEGRVVDSNNSDGIPKPTASYYDVFYAYYLSQGCKAGEAHLKADKAAKSQVACDAEIWESDPEGGVVTPFKCLIRAHQGVGRQRKDICMPGRSLRRR